MPSDRDALMALPAPRQPRDERGVFVAWMLRAGIVVALLVVIVRVVQLQVAPSVELRSFVESRTSTSTLGATRGDLLDREK